MVGLESHILLKLLALGRQWIGWDCSIGSHGVKALFEKGLESNILFETVGLGKAVDRVGFGNQSRGMERRCSKNAMRLNHMKLSTAARLVMFGVILYLPYECTVCTVCTVSSGI